MKFAADHEGVEATAARPGMIYAPGGILKPAFGAIVGAFAGIQNINVVDLSRVMLDQVINGFEKDPLSDADLVRLASVKP